MDFVDAPTTRLSSLRSLKTVASLSRAEYRSGRETIGTPQQDTYSEQNGEEVLYDSQKVAELLKGTPTKREGGTAQNTPRQVLHKLKSGDHGAADRDIVENLKKQVKEDFNRY
jgi:hypothetical protein